MSWESEEFEYPDDMDWEQETDAGDGLPASVSFLGDVIKSLGERFDAFKQFVAGGLTETFRDTWQGIGDLVSSAYDWFRQADYEIRQRLPWWERYEEAEGIPLVDRVPEGEGYEYRKTFADVGDVHIYARTIRHLVWVVVREGSLYHVYIGKSA